MMESNISQPSKRGKLTKHDVRKIGLINLR